MSTHKDHSLRRVLECRIDREFHLKKNAQVMLVRNIDVDGRLANGSVGKVVGFLDVKEYEDQLQQELKERSKPKGEERKTKGRT